jgi:hypothetical protein
MKKKKSYRFKAANGGMLNFDQWKVEHAKTNPRPTGGGMGGYRAKQRYDAQLPQLYSDYTTSYVPPVQKTPEETAAEKTAKQARTNMTTERDRRVARTGTAMERAAKGNLPSSAKPSVAKLRTGLDGGLMPRASGTNLRTTGNDLGIQAAATPTMETVDTAVTVDQTTANQIQPTLADTTLVTTTPTLTAAQGTLSDPAGLTDTEIANFADVKDAPTIAGQQINIKQGALQEQVSGIISPQAMATAAQSAGTSLARITRAKKQLRTAGLSEEAITSLGDNPQALEAKLTTFTEQERGIVEGLPTEALVTTQLDTLLKGMEEGNIPSWAGPAVASVEQMLAQRGLEASSVGRDGLINAIIQSAIPLAQANATALQSSISLDRQLIAQEEKNNAALRQQVSVQNAQNVFNMNMAQFNADQQRAVNNSKFLQTVSLSEANNSQQATIQNAVLAASVNQQEATLTEKLVSQNAANFLKMDLSNLSAEQQTGVINAQAQQQALLSNQSAANAMSQFNARNQIQVEEFMLNLNSQIQLNNANREVQMNQFNTAAKNAANARDAGRLADVEKFNTQMAASIEQYNASQAFAREEFNAKNEQQIQQSNALWRREANRIDTAAQNAVNARNAQNSFAMSQAAQAQLWQELRDEFDQIFKSADNTEQRKTQIAVAGLGNQHLNAGDTSATSRLKSFIELFK